MTRRLRRSRTAIFVACALALGAILFLRRPRLDAPVPNEARPEESGVDRPGLAPGAAPAQPPAGLQPGSALDPPRTSRTFVRGRIEGWQGRLPEGGVVRVVDAGSATSMAHGPVAADGRFDVDVSLPTVALRARVEAWIPGVRRTSVDVDLVRGAGRDVVIVLPTETVRGRLVGVDDEPAGEVAFFVFRHGPPTALFERDRLPDPVDPRSWSEHALLRATTDRDGRFELRGLPLGVPYGAATPDPDAWISVVGEASPNVFVPKADRDVVLRLGYAWALKVRLSSSSGGAVEGGILYDLRAETEGAAASLILNGANPTIFRGLIPRGARTLGWTLRIERMGYEPAERAVRLGPERWVDDMTIELRTLAGQMGRLVFGSPVVDGEGRPVRLRLAIERRVSGGTTLEYQHDRPRPDGRWEIPVSPGEVVVSAFPSIPWGEMLRTRREIHVAGRETEVVFELPAHGSVRLRVDPASAKEGVIRALGSRNGGRPRDEALPVVDGEVFLPALAEGEWAIDADVDGTPRRARFRVIAGREIAAVLEPAR